MLRKEEVCKTCERMTEKGCLVAGLYSEEIRFCPWMKYEYDMGRKVDNGWISVTERLPETYDRGIVSWKKSDYMLVAISSHGGTYCGIAYLNASTKYGSFWSEANNDDATPNVTHWMPLPQLPATYRQKKGV